MNDLLLSGSLAVAGVTRYVGCHNDRPTYRINSIQDLLYLGVLSIPALIGKRDNNLRDNKKETI